MDFFSEYSQAIVTILISIIGWILTSSKSKTNLKINMAVMEQKINNQKDNMEKIVLSKDKLEQKIDKRLENIEGKIDRFLEIAQTKTECATNRTNCIYSKN